MINIKMFVDSKKRIVRIESKGHGDYDNSGKDIVCSAVSVYLINTINTLTEILELNEFIEYIVDYGNYKLSIHYDNMLKDKIDKATIIMDSLRLALVSVEDNYKEYINVEFEEVR